MYRKTYSNDPRWIIAKYPGTDVHGRSFAKGERVLYFPLGKRFITGEAAEDAWRQFESEAQDDALNTLAAILQR